MDKLSVILSCIAVLISGASFLVSYRSYVLNKNKEMKLFCVNISNLILHYEKFRPCYGDKEIYFQIDFLFDIVPITENATALTSDKTWVVNSRKEIDGYFREYYKEIQDMKDKSKEISLYTKNKKILYLRNFHYNI